MPVLVIDGNKMVRLTATHLASLYITAAAKRFSTNNVEAASGEEANIHHIIDAVPNEMVRDVFHMVCQFQALMIVDAETCDGARKIVMEDVNGAPV